MALACETEFPLLHSGDWLPGSGDQSFSRLETGCRKPETRLMTLAGPNFPLLFPVFGSRFSLTENWEQGGRSHDGSIFSSFYPRSIQGSAPGENGQEVKSEGFHNGPKFLFLSPVSGSRPPVPTKLKLESLTSLSFAFRLEFAFHSHWAPVKFDFTYRERSSVRGLRFPNSPFSGHGPASCQAHHGSPFFAFLVLKTQKLS